jgi:hypothetical protein
VACARDEAEGRDGTERRDDVEPWEGADRDAATARPSSRPQVAPTLPVTSTFPTAGPRQTGRGGSRSPQRTRRARRCTSGGRTWSPQWQYRATSPQAPGSGPPLTAIGAGSRWIPEWRDPGLEPGTPCVSVVTSERSVGANSLEDAAFLCGRRAAQCFAICGHIRGIREMAQVHLLLHGCVPQSIDDLLVSRVPRLRHVHRGRQLSARPVLGGASEPSGWAGWGERRSVRRWPLRASGRAGDAASRHVCGDRRPVRVARRARLCVRRR